MEPERSFCLNLNIFFLQKQLKKSGKVPQLPGTGFRAADADLERCQAVRQCCKTEEQS